MPGGKVGGVGDVIRDLPAAVAAEGWNATVLTPSYGTLHELPGARACSVVRARFRGQAHEVGVYEVPGSASDVRNVVLDHALFMPTDPGVVYHGDEDDRPFATDANKFAFFCSATAAWIESQETAPAALHLHDWHAATLAALRAFDKSSIALRRLPMFFTIHNLSYQGQRPFADDSSSFEAWFPELRYESSYLVDPAEANCYNPMAAAIRLSDRVNAVSPTYAEEILHPSEPASGFIGGEGLEGELKSAADEKRLIGILNGCDYSGPSRQAPRWSELHALARKTVEAWAMREDASAHSVTLARLDAVSRRKPLHLLTSVGRVVSQKMRLFLEKTNTGDIALEDILNDLGDRGVLFLLGSGERRYEKQIESIAEEYENLVYFRGYSEALGNALYAAGDLFLMPSSFEPCGISQMVAMRDGQPCVVHGVGGLYDTVQDGVTGFVFDGDSPRDQATAFVECVESALALQRADPLHWQSIRDAAKAQRFDWSTSARQYVKNFYERS